MGQAIRQAWSQWGTPPNPRVGAVVVNSGRCVGRGAHAMAGQPHAEVLALQDAGTRARGATVYVTLEPCNHTGRTGPCSSALIEAGVTRVVIGSMDPTVTASGGAERLRSHGIEVSTGVCEEQTDALLREFISWQGGMASLSLKIAQSLDGCIADYEGKSQWISGTASRKRVHQLRRNYGAVMTSYKTLVTDNAQLTVRDCIPAGSVTRIIAMKNLKSAGREWRLWQSEDPVVVWANTDNADARLSWEELGAEVVIAESLAELRQWLLNKQIYRVLVEAGGVFNGALLQNSAVDYAHVFVAPIVLGSNGTRVFEGNHWPLNNAPQFLASIYRKHGRDLEIFAAVDS